MRLIIAALLLITTVQAQALALGPDEFIAAKQLSCVLAHDALGYLSDEEYETQVDNVLTNYEAELGDVIYAKALGYFDGLMFGIVERDQPAIEARLRDFSGSQACSQQVGLHFSL